MQYDLVFEGGGAKGVVFIGALRALQEDNCSYGRLLGTSAGAITATLLAAGYDAAELLAALEEKDENGQPAYAGFLSPPPPLTDEKVRQSQLFQQIQETDIPFLPDILENKLDDWVASLFMNSQLYRQIFCLLELGGWYSADKFTAWFQSKLDTGLYNGKPRHFSQTTLASFHDKTGVDLSLVVSNTSVKRVLVLNHRTAPDCPLVAAVRMSMNIPFVWPEIIWQAAWGLYRGKQDLTGNIIVDGGILSNFPIELFVADTPEVWAVMGPQKSDHVIGLLIDETTPVPNAPTPPNVNQSSFDISYLEMTQRIERLLNTLMEANDNRAIETYQDYIVRLPAKGYGTTEFDMSTERKQALIAAGYQAMQAFLKQQTQSVSPDIAFSLNADEDETGDVSHDVAMGLLDW